MKRKTILALLALTVCTTFMGCSKGNGNAVNTNPQNSSEIQTEAIVDNKDAVDYSNLPESNPADFVYEVLEDGSGIGITDYTGDDKILVIPSEIDGYTVSAIGTYTSDGEYSGFIYLKSGLEGVVIPDTVKIICRGAFYMCYNIKEIHLGNGVEEIHCHAFNDCPITEIEIPASVKKIEDCVFLDSKLEKIVFDGDVEDLNEDFMDGISRDQSPVVYGPANSNVEAAAIAERLEFIAQ